MSYNPAGSNACPLCEHRYAPLLSEEPKCRASNWYGRSWSRNIPDCEGDLGAQWEVTVPHRESDPFVPPAICERRYSTYMVKFSDLRVVVFERLESRTERDR
jgi:hypothetical protein